MWIINELDHGLAWFVFIIYHQSKPNRLILHRWWRPTIATGETGRRRAFGSVPRSRVVAVKSWQVVKFREGSQVGTHILRLTTDR